MMSIKNDAIKMAMKLCMAEDTLNFLSAWDSAVLTCLKMGLEKKEAEEMVHEVVEEIKNIATMVSEKEFGDGGKNVVRL